MSQLPVKISGPVAVIGDVHGQVDKLESVIEQLQARPDFRKRAIVFMGDFVDRGPDPRGAIDIVLDLQRHHPCVTSVAGNHEFAMCSALGWIPSPESAHWPERWVSHYDAETTFASYEASFGELDDLNAKIPASHRDFLKNLPWCVEHPQYLFVHAGLDPARPFSLQIQVLRQRDFTLHRPDWLCSKELVFRDPPADCGKAVVSGHVRVPKVEIRPKRVLVDTTGGSGGELSCVLLPEKTVLTSGQEACGTVGDGGKSWWKFWG